MSAIFQQFVLPQIKNFWLEQVGISRLGPCLKKSSLFIRLEKSLDIEKKPSL